MIKIIASDQQAKALARQICKGKGNINNYNRTTFRLSPAAKYAMDIRVAQDGYGLRGKSRWIMDAVNEFLNSKTWVKSGIANPHIWKRIVIDTELQRETMVKDAINLTDEMRIHLWRAAIDAALYGAESEEPVYLEISIASVIRAAVMWKLSQKVL
jgi:hypothetical protein